MTAAPTRPRAGRPRDPALDDRILAATVELLATERLGHFTMQELADRAGIGKPAIYRRWPELTYLVAEILERMIAPPIEFRDPGTLRRDLLTLVSSAVRGRQAMAVVGVLAELGVDEVLRDAYLRGPRARLLDGIDSLRVRAVARQEPAPDTRAILAAVAYAQCSVLISGREPDAGDVAGVVDALIGREEVTR